ncbi:Nudix family hydrolase [methane-oxidizing endosymbiont of Gigantopelta aegis]|uniref:Nudix family hydrolase n=1 Tax=methane-oxidizing endosymbiont of Gigantopelta aegis TaxID=2794938 RepID=UPI0018DE8178|nr:Nudix family hydrolase [methane-oxidizing endosymbiont of Gigantopelta aegis]
MNTPFLHVAVGVIERHDGHVLIAKRHAAAHQGGLWEFPGGKREAGETIEQALQRELAEELGIAVRHSEPLIKIPYQYHDRSVLLDVWRVKEFTGKASGREGQDIAWVNRHDLLEYDFPAANRPIINAISLPPFYAILEGTDEAQVLTRFEQILTNKVNMVQIRLKTLKTPVTDALLAELRFKAQAGACQLLFNSALPISPVDSSVGIHLTGQDLMRQSAKPEGFKWVAASCHTVAELAQAEKIGVDFAVLAPVQTTASHPDAPALGWPQFKQLTENCGIPVYALGGVGVADLPQVKRCGGQGVAGIRTFIKDSAVS